MKKIVLLVLFNLIYICSFSQSVNEVTLVVTGEGTTKEEAISQALRSAIEQAFGVFVSANTDILNDDIVKDEIATLTTGNIKSFVELASMDVPSGGKSVTLQAVVSIGRLIEYSKSHGSKAEFAGATFGANLKLRKLNTQNEIKIMEHYISSIDPGNMFNARISILKEPVIGESVYYEHGWKPETGINAHFDFKLGDDIDPFFHIPNFTSVSIEKKSHYHLGISISYLLSDYGYSVIKNLSSVLSSLALSPYEIEQYLSSNTPYVGVSLNEHIYRFRSPLTAIFLYRLSCYLSFAMFGNWDMVISRQDTQSHYVLSAPYYFPYHYFNGKGNTSIDASGEWIDAFSHPISEQAEFLLESSYYVDEGNILQRPTGIDELRAVILGNKYDFNEVTKYEDVGRPRRYFYWRHLENSRIILIANMNVRRFGIEDNNRNPFPLALVPVEEGCIILTPCWSGNALPYKLVFNDNNKYSDEFKNRPYFKYTSFIFDCLDWQENKPVSIKEIVFPMSFSEDELADITSIQLKKREDL